MKKVVSMALSVALVSSLLSGFGLSAKADAVVFKHQNIVGSQTPYSGSDLDEVTISEVPQVYQGMRINQPVFRAVGLTASKSYTVRQELKDGTVVNEETAAADDGGVLEFKHARGCEMIEILDGGDVVASLGTEKEYTNGVMITYAPMSWQVYQRGIDDTAEIVIKGVTDDASKITVEISGDDANQDEIEIEDNQFTYTKTLGVGTYNILVSSDKGEVAAYENVAVGDVWVAAGQSNMTDMGAITDGFNPETDDPINDNMHIIYAEDTTWHKMSHPAGEGRFFKSGIRTSPVTSFAREISESENVPVGIVQSSVGGTNIFQWVSGVRDSDANSGYLIKALESCFVKMPSHNVKGILWYQGCNDAINESYAYNYKNLQQRVFDAMRDFFGADTPIITTQINDANQDSTSSVGYYDAWSFVKDVQRQNEDLYENVYVIGTSDLELGDTIHNSAKENLKVGARWANVAKNVVYGDTTVNFRQPTIESAKVTGEKEITLTFKNTNGLKAAAGSKRIGITNGLHTEELGDLTKEFIVRKGGSKVMTASNTGKGTELTVVKAEIVNSEESDEDYSITEVTDTGAKITGAKINQKNDGNTEAQLIIAQYQNGVIKGVKSQPVTLNKGENNIDLNIDTISGTDVRAFLWDDISVSEGKGMKPLAMPYPGNNNVSAKVILTTEEDLAGVVAVDCMYGKRFTPTLVDSYTNESVLAFYNVIAEYDGAADVTQPIEVAAEKTADLNHVSGVASDSSMTVNYYKSGSNDTISYGLIGFNLRDVNIDLSKIVSAKLAVYADSIESRGRSGQVTVSEVSNEWDSTATYGNPVLADIKTGNEITSVSGGTASIFPSNNYSSIDITDYIQKISTETLAMSLESNYASEATLEGKNSEHPPKLIIQPGHRAELTYILGGVPCSNAEVTIEGSGATDYAAKTFKTDSDGKIRVNLTEGSYKATTDKKIGAYNASENSFTVSDGDVTESYTLTANDEEPEQKEKGVYDFSKETADSDSAPIKKWTNSPSTCTDAEIGDTGIKLSIAAGNVWTTAKLITNAEKGKDLLAPNGSPEFTGTYLFMGAGGNAAYTMKLPEKVEAGKYINFRYLRPSVSNNGSTNRTAENTHTITVGAETVDAVKACKENDKAYVTSIYVPEETDTITYNFGQWGSLGIESIYVTDSADVLELTAEDNKNLIYIGSSDNTIQYSGKIYNSITYPKDGGEATLKGALNSTLKPAYSVKNGEGGEVKGVEINENGLLTVSDTASEGKLNVIASYGSYDKRLELELQNLGDADGVKIAGDEMVERNGTLNLKAIPTVNGATIPERATDWTIEGDALGCSIVNGVLTAGNTAGNITVKATLKVEGKQTTAYVSDTFTVTVKGEDVSPYSVKGVFLKNGAADLAEATGVDGIAVDTDAVSAGYKAVIKALDENDMVIAETSVNLDSAQAGVTEIKTPLTFTKAVKVKAYVVNSANAVVSEEIYKTTETLYKNVPIVSDWITGAKSGLGMGAGIMAPTGAPYGVDPSVVDVSSLNVRYTYDNETYPSPTADNALWYKTGAYLAGNSSGNNSIYARDGVDWEQKALPIGNGYMGAMLFGLPDKDQIQLNEETFWAAGYRGVQTSVAANNVNKNMSEGINGFMSVGNLFIDMGMPKNSQIKNYYRDLNLDDAVAHVQYEYDGIKYSREYFASYPKEVVAIHYTADAANALTFDVKPVSMHPGDVTVNDGEITIIGKLKDSEPYSAGGNAAWNQESDLEYCTKIKVIADGGAVTDGYNTVNVKNANEVTILVTAATDYDKDLFTIKSDGTVDQSTPAYKSKQGVQAAINKATNRMNGAAAMTYDALKAEHIADYKSQFDTVKFTLTDDDDEVCLTPTDELQGSYNSVVGTSASDGKTTVSYDSAKYAALNKHLEELHFNYARYMMISSSRSNTMPATLQGKWCQSTAEIWGSCYCININMEMNYWFAGGANLLDSSKSLIRWFNSQIPAGRVTAKNMYKVTPKSYTFDPAAKTITFTDSANEADDVFIMHTKQAIMGTTDLTGGTSIQSAGNTAWLMYNLWDIYQTSGDKELLGNDLYPIMRKAANFYTQYIYTNEKKSTTDTAKYPDGYYYTTWAGRSPEQGPTHEGIKYDLQLVAGMYDYTIAAAETLEVDADKVAAWKEIRNHLEFPVELGGDGEIKEWSEEVRYNTDASGNTLGDPVHRHISHLVGLYPGTLINRGTADLLNGAKIVLQNRGDDSTGWSCSNKFLLWARTLEGDKALELFRYQLAKKTYSNLFDTHAPFQIDGNFGSAAGVMELLMQSQPLNQEQMNTQTAPIYILPALPSVWDKGEISGIKAKNGAEVSIKWNDGKATEIKIKPAKDGDIAIGYDKDNTLKLDGSDVTFTDGIYTIKNAVKGTTYIFTAE